MIIIIFND